MMEISLPCFAALWGYLFWRNNAVRKHQLELIRQIGDAYEQDVENGWPYDGWRFRELETVSYVQLWLSFRRINSFYPDRRFLEPRTEKGPFYALWKKEEGCEETHV